MSVKNWMKELALHYDQMRSAYPDDELIIVFDIDGTILDMRFMVLHILRRFDRVHGTRLFIHLSASDIRVHENRVDDLLAEAGIEGSQARRVLDWYHANCWSPEMSLEAHRPFAGVMEVMRWFQIQPRTQVGLNTARPEFMRADTLRCLNDLGKEYKVTFNNSLLCMSPYDWNENVQEAKTAGIRYFRDCGYRVFAFIDNEPDNLKAVSQVDPASAIMLFHADTLFESARTRLPTGALSGKTYDITDLADERALPQHVQFVWHGVNDNANLRQFLASDVQWGEVDVRLGPGGETLVLHHDPIEDAGDAPQHFVTLEDVLKSMKGSGKALKLDMKDGGPALQWAIEALLEHEIDDDRLWINGQLDVLGEDGFRRLAEVFPSAIIQCPRRLPGAAHPHRP